MTWRAFVQAHWAALVAADFFTTEVWTARGSVTYYAAFVPEAQSRRVQMVGCTPYPDEAFVIQCLRQITGETGSSATDAFWSVIAIQSGAAGWSSGWPREASAWFGHRRVRRTATRTPSGSSAR
jgi:hypothetical protein